MSVVLGRYEFITQTSYYMDVCFKQFSQGSPVYNLRTSDIGNDMSVALDKI